MNKRLLRAREAYWVPDSPVLGALQLPPDDLDKDALVALVYELDRRFIQLWDKVVYERENKLINY